MFDGKIDVGIHTGNKLITVVGDIDLSFHRPSRSIDLAGGPRNNPLKRLGQCRNPNVNR